MAYRGLEVFWHRPLQEPPVLLEDWIQRFQLIVIAKEETDIEYLFPPSDPEEPPGTEDQRRKGNERRERPRE